jgi:hypothetical protein
MLLDSAGNTITSARGRRRARRELIEVYRQDRDTYESVIAIGYNKRGMPRRTMTVRDALRARGIT